MNNIKKSIKRIVPDSLLRYVIGLFYGWRGNYKNWEEASGKCSGYGTDIIIEKVRDALLQVKNGTAVYERDSVLFDEAQYSFPLLSAIMWISAQKGGRLNVLDFGGSLGSTYYQNKQFLDPLKECGWFIVEQPKFVQVGQELFSDKHLQFYDTIDNCLDRNHVDVIIFSSVLQYINMPYDMLQKVLAKGIEYIIIDKTHFIDNKGIDRITIQKVPEKIYKAEYPCRFFDETRFLDFFDKKYKLIFEFDADEFVTIKSRSKGFFFKRRG